MPDAVVVIPSVLPQRQRWLGDLLAGLRTSVPNWPVLVSVQGNQDRDARTNHDRAWKIGGSCCRGATQWVILIEDDAVLSPDFGVFVPEVLDRSVAHGVTFYSNRAADLPVPEKGYCMRALSPVLFCGEICLAVAAELVIEMVEWLPTWYAAHPEHKHAHDYAVGDFFHTHGLRMDVVTPSQVQHRDGPSLLGHGGKRRQSRSYAARYGEIERA